MISSSVEGIGESRPGKIAVVLSGGGATGAYEVGVLKALYGGKSRVTQFKPLDPDIFSGTSIGSFNSAVLVSSSEVEGQRPVEYLADIWLNDISRDGSTSHNRVFRFRANPGEFLSAVWAVQNPFVPIKALALDTAFLAQDWLSRGMQFLNPKESLERKTLKFIDVSTLISNEPEIRLISDTIRAANLLKSVKLLKMAATNWDTGELKIFTNHLGTDLGEILMSEELVAKGILSSTAIPGIFSPVEIGGAHYVDGGVS
jgi:NTE family protein